ncbi:MAG TPA: toll/interleukin-1 receptor domain-containing protein, partial [Steroidobacteraceae bacterium]|nr:toll/interleukin-1 receptor domain-containing protein [Steroidobacteraceae bacterium]
MNAPKKAVFLSYASEDAPAALRICEALRAAGIEVWFDQSELRGGDVWDRQIRKQVHDCALFIAIVSRHSNARTEGYFRREWRLAVERTHDMADDRPFLLPVAIDDTTELNARVPDQFREVQWTRIPDGATPEKFIEQVRRLLFYDQSVELSSVAGAPADAARTLATAGIINRLGRRRSAWRSWAAPAVITAALLLAG